MSDQTAVKTTLRRLTDQDRRRFRRVFHEAQARFLWRDGQEFIARTHDIGGGGMSFYSNKPVEIDEDVVIYVEDIGRFSGKVARRTHYGFAVRLHLVPIKREKLIDQLTWLVNKDALNLSDERRTTRRNIGGRLLATFESGVVAQCNVIDLSLQGVALHTVGPRPEIGSLVRVGKRLGKCARYVENGFAVEFTKPQS